MLLPRPDPPDWASDGRDWPNREASRFVHAGDLRWHVQEMGAGPPLLLLHGTGASTHSFRDLMPALARDFRVLAPDLPGHGFTGTPRAPGLSLSGMARLLGELCLALAFPPAIAAGHSAGAAALVAMALQGPVRPRVLVALNGALKPIEGTALLSPLAKLLFLNPLAPRLFAWRATRPDAVERLLEGTGSRIDARGLALYARLFARSGHVAGTLGMMANWDPGWLAGRLGGLKPALVLVTGAGDKAVAPKDAAEIAGKVPHAKLVALPFGGHLVHEEQPERIAGIIRDAAREAGVLPGEPA